MQHNISQLIRLSESPPSSDPDPQMPPPPILRQLSDLAVAVKSKVGEMMVEAKPAEVKRSVAKKKKMGAIFKGCFGEHFRDLFRGYFGEKRKFKIPKSKSFKMNHSEI
jgi:hypothetical protein